MNNCRVVTVEILTDKQVTATIKNQQRLEPGCWSKKKLQDDLARPRNTINEWDRLLISLSDVLPDYEKLRKPGPLNDYHRFVLKKISRFQNRRSPWKTMSEIESFITRNADRFSFSEYMKQFTGA